MDVDEDGILAQIIHDKDSVVPVGSEIAVVTNDRESYLSFFEKIRLEKLDEQKALEFAEDFEAKHQKPSATVLMKVIKSLVREGKIKAGSGSFFDTLCSILLHFFIFIFIIIFLFCFFSFLFFNCYNDFFLEFATTLMGLARKGDTQLINVFEASCEGLHYDDETFDNEFFLENAQAIVDEVLKKKDE